MTSNNTLRTLDLDENASRRSRLGARLLAAAIFSISIGSLGACDEPGDGARGDDEPVRTLQSVEVPFGVISSYYRTMSSGAHVEFGPAYMVLNHCDEIYIDTDGSPGLDSLEGSYGVVGDHWGNGAAIVTTYPGDFENADGDSIFDFQQLIQDERPLAIVIEGEDGYAAGATYDIGEDAWYVGETKVGMTATCVVDVSSGTVIDSINASGSAEMVRPVLDEENYDAVLGCELLHFESGALTGQFALASGGCFLSMTSSDQRMCLGSTPSLGEKHLSLYIENDLFVGNIPEPEHASLTCLRQVR